MAKQRLNKDGLEPGSLVDAKTHNRVIREKNKKARDEARKKQAEQPETSEE